MITLTHLLLYDHLLLHDSTTLVTLLLHHDLHVRLQTESPSPHTRVIAKETPPPRPSPHTTHRDRLTSPLHNSNNTKATLDYDFNNPAVLWVDVTTI